MIKVLQIDSSSEIGGGQKIMFNITKILKDDFNFIVFIPFGYFFKKYSKMNVILKKLEVENLFKIIKKIKTTIKEEKPEIIHCHGTRVAFWTRLAVINLKNRPKIIYTLHGFHIIRKHFFIKWILVFLEKFLNQWTDMLVCVSEADKKLVLRYKTISKEKIFVIKNGININDFLINKNFQRELKNKFKVGDNFLLISIGRLHKPKNFSIILKALKRILQKTKKINLLIVGDGPLKEVLKKETEKLGLVNHVKFLGWREDISFLINISDVLILSSEWEGLPLALLEAGACKKPVIGSEIESIKDVIIDGKTGFLFKNEEDLADKIFEFYKSKKLRKSMGEKGYTFVLENFSEQKMVKSYKSLYQKIL